MRILFIIAMLCLPYLYRHHCMPFRLGKFHVEIPSKPEWDVKLSEEETQRISAILSQRFFYLGKGVQSYAFESDDGKYVLKLFRFDQSPFDSISWIKGRSSIKKRPEKIFSGCKLSYDLARDETGLIWVHLNPAKGWPLIRVRDYLGMTHRIDPSRYRFVLQRKAVKLFSALQNEQNRDALVQSFSTLMDSLNEKGIAPLDLKIASNFGVLDGRVVQIDFADNAYDPELARLNTEIFKEKLQGKMYKFR